LAVGVDIKECLGGIVESCSRKTGFDWGIEFKMKRTDRWFSGFLGKVFVFDKWNTTCVTIIVVGSGGVWWWC
jgi:hypothetical protein